jgi:CDP-diacylglycerol--glycerol-3-phosphate 3-phosphatidyltransferase
MQFERKQALVSLERRSAEVLAARACQGFFFEEELMTPNQVTLARVAAAFVAVALLSFGGRVPGADFAAVGLTIAAMALDGVDGYLARRRGMATPLGAQLDVLGDRVVENLFFTFFAVSGLVSLWVPVLFFVRGTATDFLRLLAAREGRCGFAGSSMLETRWGRAWVASRASRAAYAVLKCICFCYLGFLLPIDRVSVSWLRPGAHAALVATGHMLVAATVVFCVARAIPVLWEGRRYLAAVERVPVLRARPRVRAASSAEAAR